MTDSRAYVVVALLIALFGWLGLQVHDSISGLGDMARGIRDTGTQIETSGRATGAEVRRGLGDAASSLDALPIVGDRAASSVRRTASATAAAVEKETQLAGRRLVVAGRQGERDAQHTARLVGWLAFLIPTVLLLAQVFGPRWLSPAPGSARQPADVSHPSARPAPRPR
jgi:hypothetical protein